MKIILIWGYLGSGKTTLINRMLHGMYRNSEVVVVENEFGEIGIDSIFFNRKGYVVKEINAGCICCSLRSQLPQMLVEVEELKPDVVFIEPSGISSLEELLPLFEGEIDRIITTVDVSKFHFLMKLNQPFFDRQFRLSSVFYLTKTDQLSEDENNNITGQLKSINPLAHVFTEYDLLENHLIKESKESGIYVYAQKKGMYVRDEYQTMCIPGLILSDRECTDAFIKDLTNPGNGCVVRIKGFIQTYDGCFLKIDYVSGTLSMEAFAEMLPVEEMQLVIIGLNLNKENILSRIDRYMHKCIKVKSEHLTIAKSEIYSYMGITGRESHPHIDSVIENQLNEIKNPDSLCFGYKYVKGYAASKASIVLSEQTFQVGNIIGTELQGANFYVILLATVGAPIDSWLQDKHDKGDIVDTFVADAIGSVLAEAVVSYALDYLENEMGRFGNRITNSYSPGYCGWHVSCQQTLFSLLPDDFCGVSLTESGLMLPVKSVSAVIGIGKLLERKEYRCAICNKKDCYKRNI